MLEFRLEWLPETDASFRVLKLFGPFTINGVVDFQHTVRERPPGLLVIDVADVPYMDSTALGSLLGMHVTCQRDKRAYALVGVPSRVDTLFRVAGVAGVLIRADSVEAAVAGSQSS